MWWLLHVCSASAAPMAEMPAPTEPVLEWAVRDRRRSARSRAGLLLSTISPGVALVGYQVSTTYSTTEATSLGGTLAGVGIAGMVVGPPLLLEGSWSAANALRRQGLEVSRAPAMVGVGSFLVSAAAAPTPLGAFGLTSAAYLGSIVLGGVQQATNHRARRGAGWVDALVIPTPNGVQLGASF